MPIVNIKNMLQKALTEKYAVGAFNILDYLSMKSVVDSAVELNAPVIIQTSVKTVNFWGYDAIISWFKELAGNAPVPVAIHLDHCKDINVIKNCIEKGWTSVMIDASSLPFEENLNISQNVINLAHSKNVSVETELGAIVGVEDDIHVNEQDAHLADIDQAVEFCQKVNHDCFAPAIGTAHGVYKGKPKIDFDLLQKISDTVQLPLALHGGTGLSDEVFKKGIELGCAKINISTQLKYDLIDSFVGHFNVHPNEYNPLKNFESQLDQVKIGIKKCITLFGSEGKA